MKKSHLTYIRNIILPCLVYPAVTGLFTGGLIFLFKLVVSKAVPLSEHLYSVARENITYLPLLIIGAALLGAREGDEVVVEGARVQHLQIKSVSRAKDN